MTPKPQANTLNCNCEIAISQAKSTSDGWSYYSCTLCGESGRTKPQTKTIDEILANHRSETWATGWNNDATEEATKAIQALIAEARIEAIASYKKVNDILENEARANERQAMLDALPEKKPKVVKRKGYYPPYQPQVEQHERNGFNNAIDLFEAAIKLRGEKK